MNVEKLRPAINRSTLVLYRAFSIVSLYAVLVGVVAYAGGVAFYAVSTSWVAPIILSQADRESLELSGRLIQSQEAIENLQLDVDRLRRQVAEGQEHLEALLRLRPALSTAIQRERTHKRLTGLELSGLTAQKQSDNVTTQGMVRNLAEVGTQIDKELDVGLITKSDAVQMRAQIAKQNADLTDSKISALLLEDAIIEKTTATTTFLEILSKQAELNSEIAAVQISINTSQKQIEIEQAQIDRLEDVVKTVRKTPYYLAAMGKVDLALVPYENQASAVEGSPIYDCYLSFVLCRQVGMVGELFVGEQHGVNPVFRTDIRGFLVRLQLTEAESAKSKTLFLGGKPLLL